MNEKVKRQETTQTMRLKGLSLKEAPYWEEATQALSATDPVMATLIQQFPNERLSSQGDPFMTLVRSIVGQQISTKAADAIWFRLIDQVKPLTPEALLSIAPEVLRAVGLSARKVEYLKDLAHHFNAGLVNPAQWHQMEDEALMAELTAIRGIGRWTAEMLMIFCLLRPDIFPVDDIGLQRAAIQYYPSLCQPGEKLKLADFRSWGRQWAPWRTVASWYLWRSLDPGPIAY